MTHQAIADLDFEIQWNDTRAAKRANKKIERILTDLILEVVQAHPNQMSQILLSYMMMGDPVGRMVEKGLTNSQYFGVLKGINPAIKLDNFWLLIRKLVRNGDLIESSGFYKSLSVKEI